MSHLVQLRNLIFCALLLASPVAHGFSYEDLPAVAMDYKVHIDAGKEDCYFQYVNPGATFYVSFQVRAATARRVSAVARSKSRRDVVERKRLTNHMVARTRALRNRYLALDRFVLVFRMSAHESSVTYRADACFDSWRMSLSGTSKIC